VWNGRPNSVVRPDDHNGTLVSSRLAFAVVAVEEERFTTSKQAGGVARRAGQVHTSVKVHTPFMLPCLEEVFLHGAPSLLQRLQHESHLWAGPGNARPVVIDNTHLKPVCYELHGIL